MAAQNSRATRDRRANPDRPANVDTREKSLAVASCEMALQGVAAARDWVTAAKRTRSRELVAGAERDLQAAVDRARAAHVQWGQIGVALGMARGNAYQRYRKRPPHNAYQPAPYRDDAFEANAPHWSETA